MSILVCKFYNLIKIKIYLETLCLEIKNFNVFYVLLIILLQICCGWFVGWSKKVSPSGHWLFCTDLLILDTSHPYIKCKFLHWSNFYFLSVYYFIYKTGVYKNVYVENIIYKIYFKYLRISLWLFNKTKLFFYYCTLVKYSQCRLFSIDYFFNYKLWHCAVPFCALYILWAVVLALSCTLNFLL